jgi:hypothetical protein
MDPTKTDQLLRLNIRVIGVIYTIIGLATTYTILYKFCSGETVIGAMPDSNVAQSAAAVVYSVFYLLVAYVGIGLNIISYRAWVLNWIIILPLYLLLGPCSWIFLPWNGYILWRCHYIFTKSPWIKSTPWTRRLDNFAMGREGFCILNILGIMWIFILISQQPRDK